MTTACEPLSIEQTLRDVVEAISIARAAEITGRTPHYLRALSHAHKREQLTCRDVVLLDTEHDRMFGTRPLIDMLRMQVDARQSSVANAKAALAGATIEAVRESGEAAAALIAALAPDATDATRDAAMREVIQALNAKRRIIPILRALMKRQPQPP